MLTELRIRNLGVIAECLLEPDPGFTAVTGETGAGKTMVVSGLSLLLGERADPRLVREGATRAAIEGHWTINPGDADRIAELGGTVDGDEVIVARQVSAGRSRSFVGGAAVPLNTASGLVESWATIHGQSEQVRLASADRQRAVVDRFGGSSLVELVGEYRAGYARRRTLTSELETLTTRAQERARELDLLSFGIAEIEAVAPEPGEDVALADEARRLQSGDDVRLGLIAALAALSGDDDPSTPSAAGLLAAAQRPLASVSGFGADLAALADQLSQARALTDDLAAELARRLSGLDDDPGRIEWVAERRAALQRLTRKYGNSADEVLVWAASSRERAAELSRDDDRIEELQRTLAELTADLTARAARISAGRRSAADQLEMLVHDELRALALPKARLIFQLTPTELGPNGADAVQLLFSAHPGAEPGPLGKVASGGELSRVRLALEVVLARDSAGHTFVFDEVDAGVGGAVAVEVGRRLARLAEHVQVIVVTHLAQVAAFADRQFVVTKADDGQVTTSGLVEVSGAQRAAELARMMGGLESTESALAHADELLAEGRRR